MAKLPKNIRRPGGDLVAFKSPHGRRLLLPTDVELCKVLGINEDEYWYFQDTVAAYNGQRPEGYELIPDIQAGSVAAFLGFESAKALFVQIGIAVAAATVSYLLTPKPKEIKSGGSRRTADAIGNTKFAPQASFNSIQELANIGDAIPLIFANQKPEGDYIYGGIRVNSQLLWSQFVSLGKYQQLKALALFSHGTIGADPDYEGYAVGDTLLNTYNAHKVGLYFKNGEISEDNRIVENNIDKYGESELTFTGSGNDPFAVGVPNKAGTHVPTLTSKAFSGTRNPTTQTAFGVYSPIPNAQICRLPYELIRDPRGSSKESIKDMMRKRKKVEFARWPTRAGILRINNTTSKGLYSVNKDDIIQYQIVGMDSGETNALQRVYDADKNTPGYQVIEGEGNADAFNYRPHGVEDVDNLTTSIRENTDSLITVGEQYLIGTALVICTSNNNKPVPWSIEQTKEYDFKVIEPGEVDIPVNGADLSKHCQNPEWFDPAGSGQDKDARYSLSDLAPIFWQQIISGTELNYSRGTNDLYYAHNIYTAQRIALATVSNNRKCDVTEIGIKSTVFKRIRFANVNSQPDEEALKQAFTDRTQIQLGQVDGYAKRISLFMLQAREIGDSNWTDLINDGDNVGTNVQNHSGLFAVKGSTPEAQYNAITISHPRNQYEYRFKPFPGNYITRNELWGKAFNLLATDGGGNTQVSHFNVKTSFGDFDIAFSGNEEYRIDEDEACNPEWQLGASSVSTSGTVTSVRLNGQTQWISSPDFDGSVTSCKWDTNRVITGGSHTIVLWNEISAPAWSAGQVAKGLPAHQWQLYDGVRSDWVTTFFPNNNGAWDQVWFWQPSPERRFIVANPSTYGNPESNNHKFHVIEQTWQCKQDYATRYDHFNGSVSVTEGSGTGLKVDLTIQKVNINQFNAGFPAVYEYKATWSLDPNNLGTGYNNGDQVKIPWNDHNGVARIINVTLLVSSRQITTRAAQNFNPFDALVDWNVYEGDENSNRNEPDHEIVYVNEILKPPVDQATNKEEPAEYGDLAFAGIRINSSKEWTNFSQFSAYFKKGIKIEQLNSSGTGASNLFPEIAHALLTSTEIGAGKLVGASSVDRAAMADAADYCSKNRFFWDGTISSKLNLRDFIFEHAGYCLLDFTIIGGKFSLKPSVPVNSSNRIDKTVLPEIKCLFTDGNINDLQVSFLSPEERQTFRAAVLYRGENPNGFPETKSVLIEEKIAGGSTDPIETFDLSGFCTSRQQAEYFAFFAIRSRRLVDHGLTFKTAPQYIQFLSPGEYFRLVSEVSHTSRFRNGAKLEDGTIVSKDDVAGSEDVLYWEPGTVGVKSSTLSQAPNGVLFTVKNTTTENKVYKCESISYGEDGLIEVAGSYAPTETNGQLSVMQYWGLNGDITNFNITDDQ